MRIGVISDTHVYNPERAEMPDWVIEAFGGVDLIVHAGDVEHYQVINNLEKIAPVYAVKGNCDSFELKTPISRSINIGCGLLTIAHRPEDAHKALELTTKVMVYGHTHVATISEEDSLLIVNPGSPILPRGGMPPSVAIINTDGPKPTAEIIFR